MPEVHSLPSHSLTILTDTGLKDKWCAWNRRAEMVLSFSHITVIHQDNLPRLGLRQDEAIGFPQVDEFATWLFVFQTLPCLTA